MGFLDKLFGKKKKKDAEAEVAEREEVRADETDGAEGTGEEPKPEIVPEVVPEVPVAPTEPCAPEQPLQPIIPQPEKETVPDGADEAEDEPQVEPAVEPQTAPEVAPEVIPLTEPELTPEAEPEKEAETEQEAGPEKEETEPKQVTETEEQPAETAQEAVSEDGTSEENAPLTAEEKKAEKKSFWGRVKAGLSKTKSALFGQINDLLKNFVKVDEELLEELEELLICADVGVNASEEIIEELREQIRDGRLKEKDQVMGVLQSILERMIGEGEELKLETSPSVILVIGVNGVGKTTSIGKIANRLRKEGKRVVVAAADTFRAAAIDQLAVWCERAKVDLVRQNEGSDPAAVVFDACHAAKNKHADVLIIDTAGRLHNKTNLMNELAKIDRVIGRELPGACRENLLVLDATTGQNAIMQAKEFKNAAALTGLILNKLDGTAKGGIVISIRKELNIPVKFIGVGEKLDDMQEFDRTEFVRALFEG